MGSVSPGMLLVFGGLAYVFHLATNRDSNAERAQSSRSELAWLLTHFVFLVLVAVLGMNFSQRHGFRNPHEPVPATSVALSVWDVFAVLFPPASFAKTYLNLSAKKNASLIWRVVNAVVAVAVFFVILGALYFIGMTLTF